MALRDILPPELGTLIGPEGYRRAVDILDLFEGRMVLLEARADILSAHVSEIPALRDELHSRYDEQETRLERAEHRASAARVSVRRVTEDIDGLTLLVVGTDPRVAAAARDDGGLVLRVAQLEDQLDTLADALEEELGQEAPPPAAAALVEDLGHDDDPPVPLDEFLNRLEQVDDQVTRDGDSGPQPSAW